VGKLSIAFLMNPNAEASQIPDPTTPGSSIASANLAPFKLTARLTGIKTITDGALQIWAGWYGATSSDLQVDGGVDVAKPDDFFRLGVYHTLGNILGGSNLIGAKGEYSKNHTLWRVVVQEQMVFGKLAVDVIAEYRSARNRPNEDADFVKTDWASAGARLDTQILGPFRFLVEAGWDRAIVDGDDPQLIKATGVLAVSAGDGAGSRPTFRLFYTHGFWNDANRGENSSFGVYSHWQSGTSLSQVYGDENNGGSFGIQAEAWW
jgi:maltoporin